MLIRLPQKFSASFVTRTFFPDEYVLDRAAINQGMCYDWAYIAYCLWGNVKLWTTYYHVWVQVGRKFYDSESFQGEPDCMNLSCNRKSGHGGVPAHQVSAPELIETWSEYNELESSHWDDLIEAIHRCGLIPLRM